MSMRFPGSWMNQFFVPEADGSIVIQENDLIVTIEGLIALPEGARYHLTLDATPVATEYGKHEK